MYVIQPWPPTNKSIGALNLCIFEIFLHFISRNRFYFSETVPSLADHSRTYGQYQPRVRLREFCNISVIIGLHEASLLFFYVCTIGDRKEGNCLQLYGHVSRQSMRCLSASFSLQLSFDRHLFIGTHRAQSVFLFLKTHAHHSKQELIFTL